MKSRNATILSALVAAVVSVPIASAATVEFNNLTANWINSRLSNGGQALTHPNHPGLIYWGTPEFTYSSGYRITPLSNNSNVINVGASGEPGKIDVARFRHQNYPVRDAFLESADLEFTADVTITSDAGNSKSFDISSVYSFEHWETPNELGCSYPGSSGDQCSDRVTFVTNAGSEQTFEFDGMRYTISLSGFKTSNGNDLVTATEFWSQESCDNDAILQASAVATPVPLPGALALFVPAMLGMIGIGRRSTGKQSAC